jgi:hypothetical protein
MTQLKDLRRELKAVNCKVRTNRNSLGRFGRVVDGLGRVLPSIFTSESHQEWQPIIDIVKSHKGQMFDGEERVTLVH